jgi:putative cell wall-binding protein
MFVSGTAVVVMAGTALAANTPTVNRLAGSNRYDTSRVVANADFAATGATIAIIASGTNYPDALAATYLAGRIHGPIVLTDPNSLSPEALSALKALKTTGVDIVGGTAAVSANVASQLNSDGFKVNRLFGSNRYGTAQAINTVFPSSFVGSLGSAGPTAIIATGVNFADALSAGSMADAAAFPMVLTDPNSLSPEAQSTLQSLGIKNAVIMGGTAAISANVASQVAGMGISETRIAGADRTQTATMLAEQVEIPQLGFTNARSVLARGDDFADALSGGPHGALNKAPIVLTETPGALGQYTTAWYQSHNKTMANIDVLGGTAAVNDSTATAAQTAGSS